MTETMRRDVVTPGDRFGLTLFLAIVVHAIVILGIGFEAESPVRPPGNPPLEVTIVQADDRESSRPEDARLLAQVDQSGGGEAEREGRPSSPLPTPMPATEAGVASPARPQAAPRPSQADAEVVMTTERPVEREAVTEVRPDQPREAPLTAAELVEKSLEIASLSAEIDRSMADYAQRKRHRFLSARTRAFRDAVYLDAWRAKIERIGNLNYPEEARRRHLTGSLILDVAINPDGSLHAVTLRRSSGHKVLDDAAIRIVRLAAPFAPFPEAMRRDTDVLHITRTWQFLDSNRLETTR